MPGNRLNEIHDQVLATGRCRARRIGEQVGLLDETIEELETFLLVASDQRLALALFPAVAVGRGRARLYLAVVALVTDASALGATAEIADERARLALEYVLRDVVVACPRETARVIRAENVERRLVESGADGIDHVGEEEISLVVGHCELLSSCCCR